MNMRKMKVSSPCVQSTPFCPHLGKHFLEVADEARANGNEELAIHFIELALEVFDEVFGQQRLLTEDSCECFGICGVVGRVLQVIQQA